MSATFTLPYLLLGWPFQFEVGLRMYHNLPRKCMNLKRLRVSHCESRALQQEIGTRVWGAHKKEKLSL